MLKKFKKCVDLEKHYIHTDADGSYFVERRDDTLDIYFECSNGAIDWIHNFYFPAKPYRSMKNMWFCHRGFLKVWKTIEPNIMRELWDPAIKNVNIVGYSHGAAIAQLCYEYVRFNRPDISVSGVGFGSPRVFWGFARKAVRERFKGFVVVRNGRDLVTHLPPVLFGFRHICEVKKIGFGSEGLIDDHRPENYQESLEIGEFHNTPSIRVLRRSDEKIIGNENTCVCCGRSIPEGIQVCSGCVDWYGSDKSSML